MTGQLYSGKAEQQALDQQRSEALENAKNALADVIELVQNMLKEFLVQHEEIMANWKKYTKWADDSEMEKQEFLQHALHFFNDVCQRILSSLQSLCPLLVELFLLGLTRIELPCHLQRFAAAFVRGALHEMLSSTILAAQRQDHLRRSQQKEKRQLHLLSTERRSQPQSEV